MNFVKLFATHFNTKVLSKFELLGDQLLVEFINDTISYYMKNQQISFLTKYSKTVGGA